MKPKHQRALIITIAAIFMTTGLTLIIQNFRTHLLFFYTPSELAENNVKAGDTFRLGGLVEEGSVESVGDNTTRFIVTDFNETLKVEYSGILPNLFREGQGVVATGTLNDLGIFKASEILAKHDENYMPPNVANKLKENEMWQHNQAIPAETEEAPPLPEESKRE